MIQVLACVNFKRENGSRRRRHSLSAFRTVKRRGISEAKQIAGGVHLNNAKADTAVAIIEKIGNIMAKGFVFFGQGIRFVGNQYDPSFFIPIFEVNLVADGNGGLSWRTIFTG